MTNFDISKIWQYDLRRGSSPDPAHGACLFDAGMWLVYGRIGDNPPCSCPVIRAYGIGLDDRMPDDERQRLKLFILRVVGNRDPAAENARRNFIARETARRVVPLAFDKHWPKLAAEARAISDSATMKKIRATMLKMRDVAAHTASDAVAASDAAAIAAHFATAAIRAAHFAAYATHTAASAASAAADAAAAAIAAASWNEAIWILDNVLKIGKQSPEFDEAEVRASVRQFELARQHA